MSRLYKISRRYSIFEKFGDNFILNIFLRKFIKNGDYFKARSLIVNTLYYIKNKEKKNAYLIFLFALYNVSPRLQIITRLNPKNNKMVYKKEFIPILKSIHLGMKLILIYFKKNKGKLIYMKLGNELIDSFYKRSLSVKRKYEIEKNIFKKTANDFGRRKHLNYG